MVSVKKPSKGPPLALPGPMAKYFLGEVQSKQQKEQQELDAKQIALDAKKREEREKDYEQRMRHAEAELALEERRLLLEERKKQLLQAASVPLASPVSPPMQVIPCISHA